MNLPTIEMPQEQAEAAFKEYRHAVRSAKTASTNSEDAQIMRAYKALTQGKQIIDINEAFKTAGHDAAGLPQLAISRADYKTVQLNLLTEWRFAPASGQSGLRATAFEIWPSKELRINWRTKREGQVFIVPLGEEDIPTDLQMRRYSIVPNIPPHLRPPFALENYHLLWEFRSIELSDLVNLY